MDICILHCPVILFTWTIVEVVEVLTITAGSESSWPLVYIAEMDPDLKRCMPCPLNKGNSCTIVLRTACAISQRQAKTWSLKPKLNIIMLSVSSIGVQRARCSIVYSVSISRIWSQVDCTYVPLATKRTQ